MTDAVYIVGLEASVARDFMEINVKKLFINLWKDYSNEHLDMISQTLKYKSPSSNEREASSTSS